MTKQDIFNFIEKTITIGEQLHEENYDDIITYPLKDAKPPFNFSLDNGATKAVILIKDADFVIKIPFTGFYSDDAQDDYLFELSEQHKEMTESELQDLFDQVDYGQFILPFENACLYSEDRDWSLDYWDYCALETEVYELAVERGLDQYFAAEEFIGEINNHPIYAQERAVPFNAFYETIPVDKERSTRTKARCEELDLWCFDPIWIADFFDAYGEEEFKRLNAFLDEYEIGDIRRANIGYREGLPILFDYAGYHD